MAEVVQAIDRFHHDVLKSRDHPLCGSASVSVNTIQGGTGVNTVPDEAVIDIDRRVLPDEDPEAAYQEFIDQGGEG